MNTKTFGFIGGGRITNIFLNGFKRAQMNISDIVVSDINNNVLNTLKQKFPGIKVVINDNAQVAEKEIVFLAVHPNEVKNVLIGISENLKTDTVIVSLVPKFSISKIAELSGGKKRIVRMIPNAPSYINEGFNPAVFSTVFTASEKEELMNLFGVLGKCVEVKEENMEAYAVLTAMGPTYFWFQICELVKLGKSFGLNDDELREGITYMIKGSVDMIFNAGLSSDVVLDLIPSRPLHDDEDQIKNIYKEKLEKIYNKLKN